MILLSSVIAALFFVRVAYDCFCFFFASKLGLTYDPRKAGTWAIVTGAGAGIGRGYSLALARRGLNVCLIGRTKADLDAVAARVEKLGVKSLVIVHEFTCELKNENALRNALGPILKETAILVNNVGTAGVMAQFSTPFLNMQPSPLSYGRELIATNLDSAVLMTSIVGPAMKEKKKGAIVFLGSACGIHPIWGAGVYAAAKSFIQFFAESLRQEMAPHVVVQTVTPSWVKTKLIPPFAQRYFPSILAPEPEDFAECALKTLGVQNMTDGCLQHSIHNQILRLADQWIPRRVLDRLLRGLITLVKKADVYFIDKNTKCQ